MDREIPKEVRNKERNKKIIRFSAIGYRRDNRYQRTDFVVAYRRAEKGPCVFYRR